MLTKKNKFYRMIQFASALFILAAFSFTLFSAGVQADSEIPLDDSIVISSQLQGEVEFTIGDLKENFTEVTEEIIRRDEDGEIYDQHPIRGVMLKEVLESLEIELTALEGIRLTAGDGYSIEVPEFILETSPIILAYEIDEEPLWEDTRPIRVFIPGQETMYWVKNTVEISLLGEEAVEEEAALKEILFFETAVSELEKVDYQGSDGTAAVKTADLLADLDTTSDIYLLAADGFDKTEEYETFIDAYIVIEGENTPAFRAPDLPRGMHVRDLVWISTGSTGFLSVERGAEIISQAEANEITGISLEALAAEFELVEAENYTLTAADGYSVEVSADDLASGVVYLDEDGEVGSEFEGLPRGTAVKNLLSISPVE